MHSAKRIAFRQQIRRKQIEQKFKRKRTQILLHQKKQNMEEQASQFNNELTSIIHNLALLSNQSYYYMHHGLIDLKDLIKRKRKFVAVLAQQQYRIIEHLSEILRKINQTDGQANYKLAIFQTALEILTNVVQNQSVKTDRILQSGFIEELIPFMNQGLSKQSTLQNLFNLLGNATKQSIQVANQYSRLKIPNLVLKLVNQTQIQIEGRAMSQFLFFLRSYFQQVSKETICLDVPEMNLCLVASAKTFDHLFNLPTQKLQSFTHLLQDALKVFKQIINFEIVEFDVSLINYQKFINIVEIKNFNTNLKKQALFILDCLVFMAQQQFIEDMLRKQLLHRIWGVQQQLKHIVINIMANISIYPDLNSYVKSYLSQMKLQLKFFPLRKFTYLFIFNYFSSQNFQVKGPIQQSIIAQLWNNPCTTREITQIEAKIWYRLYLKDSQCRPPLRILQTKDIPEVQKLNNLLEGIKQNQMDEENLNLIECQ